MPYSNRLVRDLSPRDAQALVRMHGNTIAHGSPSTCRPSDAHCHHMDSIQALSDASGQSVMAQECPIHGPCGAYGAAYGHGHGLGHGPIHQQQSHSVGVRQSHTAAEIGNTYSIGTLNVNLGDGQQTISGSRRGSSVRGNGRSIRGDNLRMGSDSMQSIQSFGSRVSGRYGGSRRSQGGGPGMSGMGGPSGPGGGPSGMGGPSSMFGQPARSSRRGSSIFGGSRAGPSAMGMPPSSMMAHGGGSRRRGSRLFGGGRDGPSMRAPSMTRGPSGMGAPIGLHGVEASVGGGGSQGGHGRRGYERGYAYERQYQSGKLDSKMTGLEGKLGGGERKLRGLLGGLSRKGGRSNLRGTEFDGARSGGMSRAPGGSIFGGASRASQMPSRAGPGLLTAGPDPGFGPSRRSGARSDMGRRFSSARSNLAGRMSRANARAGSMFGGHTRAGSAMNNFGSGLRSRYDAGRTKAGSMFGGLGRRSHSMGPPSHIPGPPIHVSLAGSAGHSRRHSGADPSMALTRVRGGSANGSRDFGHSYYEPPRAESRHRSRQPSQYTMATGGRTPSMSRGRSQSHSRVSGFTASSGSSTLREPSSLHSRAPSRHRSSSSGYSPATRSILSSFRSGSSGGSRRHSLMNDGYHAPPGYDEPRGRSRMSGRAPPLSNALQRSTRSGWSRTGSRFRRAPSGHDPSHAPSHRPGHGHGHGPSHRDPSRSRSRGGSVMRPDGVSGLGRDGHRGPGRSIRRDDHGRSYREI